MALMLIARLRFCTIDDDTESRYVIEAVKKQIDTLHFSPPMHGTNPVAVQLANLLAEVAPGLKVQIAP